MRVHLTNVASLRTAGFRGTGNVFNIMAAPRHWERLAGNVPALTPSEVDLRAVQTGSLTMEAYRERFEAKLQQGLGDGLLAPGRLRSMHGFVVDGDTLCCACSREAAAEGRCHRVWAAHALVRAGWEVVLDGQLLETSDAAMPRGGRG